MSRHCRVHPCAASLALLICLIAHRSAPAQAHTHSHAEGGDHAGHNHGGEVLGYRLVQWKTMHFDDPRVAAQHLDAVKKLGCEAKQEAHSGHTDVSYRCAEWKSMTVTTHELAHQWEGWLKGAGFDSFHGHVAAKFRQGPEAVEYRLVEWKSVHAESPQQVARTPQLIDALQSLGCEVKQAQHGGHLDVSYRCPIWTAIHLADHPAAEQWMSWLKANGFETRHEH